MRITLNLIVMINNILKRKKNSALLWQSVMSLHIQAAAVILLDPVTWPQNQAQTQTSLHEYFNRSIQA